MRVVPLALSLLTILAVARPAEACGGSGPGGTGACEFPRRKGPSKLRLSASVLATDTTILFSGDRRAAMTRRAAFATVGVPLSERLTLETSLGAVMGGELRTPRGAVDVGPGAVTAMGLGLRAVDGQGAAPLVVTSITASATLATSGGSGGSGAGREPSRPFQAFDVRLSALVGKTIADVVTPFVIGRVFGGPAYWRWDDRTRVTGTDLHKFQVGAGVAVRLGDVDLFAEGVPLGERSLAGGAGVRF